MAEMPGSWLAKLKPFQAALIAGFLLVVLSIGLWGRGVVSIPGVLSIDNREADFQALFERTIEGQDAEVRRQYLARLITAALHVAEAEDAGERARFAESLEARLRAFGFYHLRDGRLRDHLALRFGHRLAGDDPDDALKTRERVAAAALEGIAQLSVPKDPAPALPLLDNALGPLGYVHVESDALLDRLRQLPPEAPQAQDVRQMLYGFEGPFAIGELFLAAPADFVAAIHALKRTDQHYYRHGVVISLWHDALEGEGIFTIERSGVEVRLDPTLAPHDAVVCRGERELYDAGFFLQRGSDGGFTHVHARPSSGSRDCRVEVLSADADLTVWLSPEGAAPLLVDQARPLTAADYPIRGVVLRRSPSHDLLPPMLAPTRGDPEAIEAIAAELVRLAGL